MIWGTIWIGGRSDLVLMSRDKAVKRNRYSVNSYINVFNQAIKQCWSLGMTFIQDNALVYTVKKVTEWFKDHEISVLDWAPYSPDLNPIKHIWERIKEWIIKHYPHL